MKDNLNKEREKVKELWKLNCLQLSEFDGLLIQKDEEIARLTGRMTHCSISCPIPSQMILVR